MTGTRQRMVGREVPRKGLGAGLAWTFGLSVGIHLCLALLFHSDWIDLGKPLLPDPPIPVEMVFLGAEPVEPETPVEAADLAELEVPPEPEPEETAELEAVEESPAEPEVISEPEPVEAPETETALAVEESEAAAEAETREIETPPAAEPPPREALAEAEPVEPLPEEAPVEAAQAVEENAPADPVAAAPEPPVIPTPLPRVKPVLAQRPAGPLEPEPQPEPRYVEVAPEQPPKVAELPAANPEPAYRSRSDIARVTPEQLLANLAAVADESLQAEKNPELWAVIRLLRRQIKQCWLYDQDEDVDDRYAVDIAVAFRRDGAVDRAEVQDVARMVADSNYDRFVRRARKALLACGPFDLPAESYGIWHSFTMRFVLRDAT